MTNLQATKSRTASGVDARVGRLFFLDVAGGRVLSANPDGSDLKTIVVEGRKIPDGLVVDSATGHMYWTNMGNPKSERRLHPPFGSRREKHDPPSSLPAGRSLPSNSKSKRKPASSTGATGKACA